MVKIGLIGCGRVAENHAQAISACPGAKLVAAGGGRNAQQFGERHNIKILPREEICTLPDIDAVLVLTPPQNHFEYVMSALKNGKHVLVEKPVSFNIDEVETMKSFSAQKGLVCMPGHSYIYLTEIARIKKASCSGSIGTPTYLYMSEAYYMPPELFCKYQGPEIDVLCHQLYMSLAFLGVPTHISAFSSNFDNNIIETGGPQVIVNLKYGNGALAQIVVSWAGEDNTSDPWTFKIKLLGSNGGIHFSRRDFVQNNGYGYEQVLYQEMFDQQMRFFINNCIIGSEEPLSTISDAAWVCRLHNMILRSIETGSTVSISEN